MAVCPVQQEGGGSIPSPSLHLEFCSSADPRFVKIRREHYIESYSLEEQKCLSAKEREAKGLKFGDRGQQIHFLIWYRGELAGIISGGSAVKSLTIRDDFFQYDSAKRKEANKWINSLVDNTVYCLTNHEKGLFGRVLSLWEKACAVAWLDIYGVPVVGFETFIDPTKVTSGGSGLGYQSTGWTFLGISKGRAVAHPKHTGMNQVNGKSTRQYGETTPKHVFGKWARGFTQLVRADYASSWKASTPAEKAIAKQKSETRKRLLGATFEESSREAIRVNGQTRNLRADFLIWSIQRQLTPDTLKQPWRERAVGEHRTFGHCYVVTEALYHLWGKNRGFKPAVVQVPEMQSTHWFLRNVAGEVVDGTKEQFEMHGIRIPYENGKGCGFLTKEPSKRCQALLEKILS